MARVSKYEKLIGTTVSMDFADVRVTGYRTTVMTSKSGKSYKKGEVEIDGIIWVSTPSFKAKSFKKRYFAAKLLHKIYDLIPIQLSAEDELQKDVRSIREVYSLDELKKVYRQLSKKYHPDLGGNAETFKEVQMNYKKRKYAIKSTTELFEECPEFADITTFEEEVDDAMINTNWDGVQY